MSRVFANSLGNWGSIPGQVILLYTHLPYHNDSTSMTDAWRKTHEGKRMKKRQEDFFRKIFTSHFIARVWKGCWRFACERMLETEHKLHILTPLLWPSRCVFLVLLILGSTPSGLSEGPLGLVWPSLSHLVSNPLRVCWQLHRGFSEFPPRLGVAFPTTSGLYCLEFDWQLLLGPKLNWVK